MPLHAHMQAVDVFSSSGLRQAHQYDTRVEAKPLAPHDDKAEVFHMPCMSHTQNVTQEAVNFSAHLLI